MVSKKLPYDTNGLPYDVYMGDSRPQCSYPCDLIHSNKSKDFCPKQIWYNLYVLILAIDLPDSVSL